MALADLLVVMNGGRIEDQGPPDRVYLRPRTRFTATFLGDSNLIEGRIADAGEGWVLVETGLGAVRARGEGRVGAATTLSLRPEQIHACEGAWALGDATISDAMFLGSHWRVEVAMPTAGRHLTLHLPPARAPRVGERLALGADPASAAVLAG